MKNFVLTMASDVFCGPLPPHGGKVVTASVSKLSVDHHPVLVENGNDKKLISKTFKCQIVPEPGPPKSEPCKKVLSITVGTATKLTVQHQPVILDSLKGTTDGEVADVTPQTAMYAEAKQTKLSAL
jgi:hypothetical protein